MNVLHVQIQLIFYMVKHLQNVSLLKKIEVNECAASPASLLWLNVFLRRLFRNSPLKD